MENGFNGDTHKTPTGNATYFQRVSNSWCIPNQHHTIDNENKSMFVPGTITVKWKFYNRTVREIYELMEW